MNDAEKEQLDNMLKIIKESVISIADKPDVTPEMIKQEIYKKGLIYLGNTQNLQNIVDIGALGLALFFKK